jgi:hypothetical protein
MKRYLAVVFFMALLFSSPFAKAQSAEHGLDWDKYQASSPLLKRTIEQLSKEHYVLQYDKVAQRSFPELFVVAFIPATNDILPKTADFGTLGLVVVFTVTPEGLVVGQVVRIDYTRNVYTKRFEIVGTEATIDKDELRFPKKEKPVLMLIVDDAGQVQQVANHLLSQTGENLTNGCVNSACEGVSARCKELKEDSISDWLRCRVAGWLWASQKCWHVTPRKG